MNPRIGFALGLLWRRTPGGSVDRYLKINEPPYIRRVKFPTWSWTSFRGEVFHELCSKGSVLEACLRGDDQASNKSYVNIRFWIYADGKVLSLEEAMKQNLTILPEDSPLLLVEGDVVRLRRAGRDLYGVWECEHLHLVFTAVFDLDQLWEADSSQDRELC
jgi:hypothetical protein